jgi:Na+/proline symporter
VPKSVIPQSRHCPSRFAGGTDRRRGNRRVSFGILLTAPLFVMFSLGLFVRWANAAGAWMGLLASAATAVAIAYAKDLGLPLGIGFVWMMPCSLLAGIVVGMAASALPARLRWEKG